MRGTAATWVAWVVGMAAAGMLGTTAASQDRGRVRNLISLYTGEEATLNNQAIDRSLRGSFGAPAEETQFFSEYLDSTRFEGPQQAQLLAKFLRERYAGKHIDLIFATGPLAVGFLAEFRAGMFPGVPVVFMQVDRSSLADSRLPVDFVGSATVIEAEPTVRLALRLRPASRAIVIVGGTSELDQAWRARLRAAAALVAPALPVRDLSGLPIEEVTRELAALTPQSVVLGGTFSRDGAGHYLPGAIPALHRLGVPSAPIFHIVVGAVGHGAVGSAGVPAEAHAERAALIAKSILAGTALEALPHLEALASKSYVDWRELRRWSINENLLPKDAVVMFRQPSIWEQYRYQSLAVAAIVLLQMGLIAALLIEARKRKRAELQTHVQRQELAHLSRVAMLGAMSVSVAHELNQPLGAILSNAEAARLFLGQQPPDLAEVDDSLEAIIRSDRRASEIIRTLRGMLVKEDVPKQELGVDEIVTELLKLLESELIVRQVRVDVQLASNCPRVCANRTQLQQVLINLVINACDAMERSSPADRLIIVRAEKTLAGARISVEDQGQGAPQALLEGKFTPFVTTKANGLGLGLAVCSSIIESQGGLLRVTNKDAGGAVFVFDLQASAEQVSS